MMETPSRRGNGNGVVKGRGMIRAAAGVLALGVLAGCAPMRSSVVRPGERATVDFTCRIGNGEIAASTSGEVARDPSLPKSRVFLPRTARDPLVLVAGAEEVRRGPLGVVSFEDAIAARLAAAIVGLREGTRAAVELGADRESAGGRLPMARVWRRPKELRLSREEYAAGKGRAPEIGQEYILDPLIPGKVTAVSDNEVRIGFPCRDGAQVETPFGKGVLREEADHCGIAIDARPGTLVRSGPLAGKIVSMNDRSFVIDYGHPFGGETLSCDVTVVSIEKREGGGGKK